jgi:hypothetical protein
MRVPDLQTPIVEGETVLGEVCHIAGASAHGPRSVHNLQTKGEISRESSGGRGRFTPREFREQRFHHRNRSSLYL